MLFIRFESGSDEGAVFPIQRKQISIGRSPENDIVVHDSSVSSFHATISYINRSHFIEDADSANGTYVNGVKVHRKRLRARDEIVIGKTQFRIVDSRTQDKTDEFPIKRADSKKILKEFSTDTPSPKSIVALRQAHENLKRIYEINGIISSIFDIDELAKKILDIIFPLFDADRGYIMLVGEESAELELIASKKNEDGDEDASEVAFSRTIAKRVLEREESIITSNAPEDKRFAGKASIVAGHIISAMCVPIRGRAEKLGIMYVDHRGTAGRFSDEHLQLLTMVAGSTGVAIENIRLYEENLKINVLKAVNEEVRETNRKLMELESLKEDLINMVVHDMKNPVTNTMMGLDLIALDSQVRLTDQQSEYLQLAKRNQFKLSEMINNLLEISKLESGKIQINRARLDLGEMIDRIINRYSAVAKREEKKVRVSIDPAAGLVLSDERLLDRIISNMLSNALKHTPAAGEIVVKALPDREHGGVTISIEDFGEGIPKEFHQKIFEKFCQAGLRELGHKTDTGLGLAFCKMAVESLGGEIWLESEPGKGSCFTFSLPASLWTEN